MQLKLLCIHDVTLCDCDGKNDIEIKEGDTVNVLVDKDGVRFEFEPNVYGLPYDFDGINRDFISAFGDVQSNLSKSKKLHNVLWRQ